MRIGDLLILPAMDIIKNLLKIGFYLWADNLALRRQANILILNKCDFFPRLHVSKGNLVSVKVK